MKKSALIMAGGRGERFWPRSRKNLPKQFMSLTGDGMTLIQLAVRRILPIVDIEDIYVSTNADYRGLVISQLPDLPVQNILCEPVGRNTAPCIGLGAAHITRGGEDSLMIVLPSDHLIKYEQLFVKTLLDACEIALAGENLVTLGLTPAYPETGYGYIRFDASKPLGHGFSVMNFTEKPDIAHAREYVSSNEYLWNSGMFVWKASTIMERFRQLMPEVYAGLEQIRASISTPGEEEVLSRVFPAFPSISVDYGIMEKSSDIYTIPASIGWDDVGSWLAMERIHEPNESRNVVNGNVITINSRKCIIQGSDKLIAAVGVEDLIVVDSEDATLICAKDSTADIKKVLENLRICNRNEYL